METYPAIAFILRYGNGLAIAVALLVPLAALLMVVNGASWLVLLGGFVAGVVAWGLLKSYVELIRVVADTLIPK